MYIILQVGRDLSTPTNVFHQLGGFRERYLSFFLEKHGQVEFALDAIIRSAEDGVVEMGSVSRSQTLDVVTLYSKCTRVLTFEKFW